MRSAVGKGLHALLPKAAPSTPQIKMSPDLLRLQVNPQMGIFTFQD